jgi:hypothetical protein
VIVRVPKLPAPVVHHRGCPACHIQVPTAPKCPGCDGGVLELRILPPVERVPTKPEWTER